MSDMCTIVLNTIGEEEQYDWPSDYAEIKAVFQTVLYQILSDFDNYEIIYTSDRACESGTVFNVFYRKSDMWHDKKLFHGRTRVMNPDSYQAQSRLHMLFPSPLAWIQAKSDSKFLIML